MENNTKRGKKLLSLKVLVFLVTFFLISCESRAQITPPIPQKTTVKVPNHDSKYDSTLYWCSNNYYKKIKDSSLKNNIENISIILKNYSLKKGKLFFKKKLLDRVYINFIIDNDFSKSIIINKGIPDMEYLYHISYIPSYIYSDNGGNIPMNQLLNIFKIGNGYWKEYFIVDYYKNKDFENIEKKPAIKEEGEVRNNFKFGEWKYYNKEGKIDSTKIYTLKDSVDVRFPHCIFNKKEPCY